LNTRTVFIIAHNAVSSFPPISRAYKFDDAAYTGIQANTVYCNLNIMRDMELKKI
jgi:hypothetical protein